MPQVVGLDAFKCFLLRCAYRAGLHSLEDRWRIGAVSVLRKRLQCRLGELRTQISFGRSLASFDRLKGQGYDENDKKLRSCQLLPEAVTAIRHPQLFIAWG